MIDIFDHSKLLDLHQAAKLLPGDCGYTTIFRWTIHGRRGVKLPTVFVGGKRWTTKEALANFIAESSAKYGGTPRPAVGKTNTKRHAATRAAKAKLAKAGI